MVLLSVMQATLYHQQEYRPHSRIHTTNDVVWPAHFNAPGCMTQVGTSRTTPKQATERSDCINTEWGI